MAVPLLATKLFAPPTRSQLVLRPRPVATGAGHHSVLQSPRSGKYYIVYHRRPLGQTDRNARVICIDELRFSTSGAIEPVIITTAGVERDPA